MKNQITDLKDLNNKTIVATEKYEEWKNEPYINDEMDEDYYYKVSKPFRERFGFC